MKSRTPLSVLYRTPAFQWWSIFWCVLMIAWLVVEIIFLSRGEGNELLWLLIFRLFAVLVLGISCAFVLEASLLTWGQRIALSLVDEQLAQRDQLMAEMQSEIVDLKSKIEAIVNG